MKKIILPCLGIALMWFTGCQPAKIPVVSYQEQMPAQFINPATDTSVIASLPRDVYFTDEALRSLVNEVLAGNPDLAIAMQRIEGAKAQLTFAKGLALPFVSGGASAGQRRFGQYTMDGIGNFDTNFSTNLNPDQRIPEHLPDFFAGFMSSWEIDVWGKLKNVKKAALARYLASEQGKNYIITNLVAQTAEAYYELQALDAELEIIRQNIDLQEKALAVINVQKQAGLVTELAVSQFEAQLLNTRSLQYEVQQQIVQTENAIHFLAGRFPQPIPRTALNFSADALPSQLAVGIPSALLQNRPDIRQAEFELLAANADIRAARAAFLPSFNLTATAGLQAFTTSFLFSLPASAMYNLLGGIAAPLLNRSALKANLGAAQANANEAMQHYRKSVLNGYQDTYNQLAALNNLQETYQLRSREVEVLTNAVATAGTLFNTGRATYLEVIMTQSNVLQTRLSLVQVRKRQYQTTVYLYRALGGGWR